MLHLGGIGYEVMRLRSKVIVLYKFFITQYYVDRTYFFPLGFHMLGSFRLKRIYELRKAFEELRPHNKPKKN